MIVIAAVLRGGCNEGGFALVKVQPEDLAVTIVEKIRAILRPVRRFKVCRSDVLNMTVGGGYRYGFERAKERRTLNCLRKLVQLDVRESCALHDILVVRRDADADVERFGEA